MGKTTTERYKENPERYEERKKQIREREKVIRKKVQDYKKTQVCAHCGFSDYRAIDFHHIDPSTKKFEPSSMWARGWSLEKCMEELNKCIPLCKNCHAIVHHPDTNVRVV